MKSGETAGPLGRRYLRDDEVPMRGGGRPRIGKWILPQRQLDMKAAEGWVEVCFPFFPHSQSNTYCNV